MLVVNLPNLDRSILITGPVTRKTTEAILYAG
jgi:Ni,Fe-hydrogenase III small subunit